MKIVLSRKGFDSRYGRRPSPIFPDGRQVSLPIPMASRSPTRFADLACAHGSLGSLVEELTRGRVAADGCCHLDPDLDPASRPRADGWRPAFGQVGAAQSHLARHAIGPGDLFLFFGWFRPVERDATGRWCYVRSARSVHRLFGWLQIGEVLPVGSDVEAARARWPWLAHHPHLHGAWDSSNTVYAAADRLSAPGPDIDLPGAGCFRAATPQLTLTDPGSRKRSLWCLPGWFLPEDGTPALSCHGDRRRWSRRGDRAMVASVPIGQEFVFDAARCPQAADWVANLVADEARPTPRRRSDSWSPTTPIDPRTARGDMRATGSYLAGDENGGVSMKTRLAATLVAGLLAVPALAHDAMHGGARAAAPIQVDDVWSRATPPTARTAALYLTITNAGDAPDRLVGASTEVAEDAHLHAHRIEDGVARMHAVDAVEIGPGETVTLEPGGLHVMLIGPRRPLAEGDSFAAELTFAEAGSVEVEVRVEAIGATGPTPHDGTAAHEGH